MTPDMKIGAPLVFSATIEAGRVDSMHMRASQTMVIGHVVCGVPLVRTQGELADLRCVYLCVADRIEAVGPLYMVTQALKLGHLRLVVREAETIRFTVSNGAERAVQFSIELSPMVLR